MPNIACAKKSDLCACDALDYSNPFQNLSSEEVDHEVFFKLWHFGMPEDGFGLCEGASQEEVDNCAEHPKVCNSCPIVCPDGCPPIRDSVPQARYYNDSCSCSFCGVTYTLAAGVVVSTISRADAQARAQSICQRRVELLAAQSKACQHLGPVPPSGCAPNPFITGYGQSSPVQKSPGDSVTFRVFYSYLGSKPLIFTWLLEGIPYATTPDATLTINNLTVADSGNYRLVIGRLGCSSVYSDNIELIVTECNQSGMAVPSDLSLPPVDLGNIEIVIGDPYIPLGDFNAGQFTITYINGAFYGVGNPCPSQWKNVSCIFRYNDGVSSVDVSEPWPCGSSQAEVEAGMFADPPFGSFLATHTGGAASFDAISTLPGDHCGSPCPTYHVVFQESLATGITAVGIKDWATIRGVIANCVGVADDPLLPVWDGLMQDVNISPAQMSADTDDVPGSVNFDGTKVFGFAACTGPMSRADLIATYEPAYGVGIFAALDPAKYYWAMEFQGYNGGAFVPCWMGVKEYGSDVLGNYSRKSTVCAAAPDCVTLIDAT